jgi:hypothetical protein
MLLCGSNLPDHPIEHSGALTVPNMRFPFLVALVLVASAGCQTPQQRKAAENAAVNKKAAEEIARICALHGAEREEELKKLKSASELDLYCPNE